MPESSGNGVVDRKSLCCCKPETFPAMRCLHGETAGHISSTQDTMTANQMRTLAVPLLLANFWRI